METKDFDAGFWQSLECKNTCMDIEMSFFAGMQIGKQVHNNFACRKVNGKFHWNMPNAEILSN